MVGNVSLWETTAPQTRYPALVDRRSADIAVIGAGIAGATTALMLQREGLDVVLLEADHVGRGATGSSTVKVTAAQGLRGLEIAGKHDESAAITYLRRSMEAVEVVASLIDELAIPCGFARTRHVVYAETETETAALRRELDLERRDLCELDRADGPSVPRRGCARGRRPSTVPSCPVRPRPHRSVRRRGRSRLRVVAGNRRAHGRRIDDGDGVRR
jgi:choline dehydrogenase-like flavoprotein